MCHSFCTIPAISAGPSSQGHGVGRPRSQAARQAAKHSRQLPSWHQTSAGCPCTERRAGPAGEALFNHQGRDLPSWGDGGGSRREWKFPSLPGSSAFTISEAFREWSPLFLDAEEPVGGWMFLTELVALCPLPSGGSGGPANNQS